MSKTTEDNFKTLRTTWETPDGWALADAMQVWKVARELALGLHYIWDPRPPEDWLEARRQWAAFVRKTLGYSRKLDSELQVVHAIDDGQVKDPLQLLRGWREIKDSFKPNSKPVWHDGSALETCKIWAQKYGGIIWTSHDFFAVELARQTGFDFYGAGGVNKNGQPIEAASANTIIASLAANGTGRNLQRFSSSLVTAAPSGGDQWEQLLGRTHREGQSADEVVYDVLIGCRESIKSVSDARGKAVMFRDTTTLSQKLLACSDFDFPEYNPYESYDVGYRWHANCNT